MREAPTQTSKSPGEARGAALSLKQKGYVTDADPTTQGYAAAPQVATDAEPSQVSSSQDGGNLARPLHRRSFLTQWEKLRASGFPKPTVFHIVSWSSIEHLCNFNRKGLPGDRGSQTAHNGSPPYS